ncbi:MAG TPA: hypothetical protein VMV03_04920 [Spirochaetia bacterium]|nr:hypothetical protein [Spirochaetia bacterium]
MEGSGDFLQQLSEALEKRARWLQSTEMPRLRETLNAYATHFESVMGILIRKGLLREDPYNYDQATNDIVVPSDKPLPDFENADEVSYRLAGFRRQLKFLTTEQEYSLAALKLGKLKKISALFTYINWQEFGDGSSSPTTRIFARVFMKVRMGTDSMTAQILKDNETQIEKLFHEGRSLIAEIVSYHREAWKAELRRTALPRIGLEPGAGPSRREEALRALRKAFGQEPDGRPWYPALAQEVIAEELEPDAAARRDALLVSLAVPDLPVLKKETPPVEGRTVLLEALRILCRPHEELAGAVESLVETERLLQVKESGFGSALRRLFRRAPREKADAHAYKIQYMEPALAVTRTETVNFPQFADETRRKASLLAAIATGGGPAYRKLENTAEGQLVAFLEKQLNELLLIHRRLTSFNTFFQARAAQMGKTVRGIKLELLALRNALVKANQRRHEYGAREEREGEPSSAGAPAERSPV